MLVAVAKGEGRREIGEKELKGEDFHLIPPHDELRSAPQ